MTFTGMSNDVNMQNFAMQDLLGSTGGGGAGTAIVVVWVEGFSAPAELPGQFLGMNYTDIGEKD